MSFIFKDHINDFVFNQALFVGLFIIITTSFSLSFLTQCFSKPKKTLPPSPPTVPILGNLHQLGILTHRSFQSLGQKYGPLILLHFGSRPVVLVQSADAAVEILKKHDLLFADKPNSRTSRRLLYDLKDITISPYGEHWRKLKSLLAVQLLSSKRVQAFSFIREEETAILMEKIKAHSGLPVNLSEMFESLTNDVMCRSAFGKRYDQRPAKLVARAMHLLGTVNVGDLIPSLSWINHVNGFHASVDKLAKEIDAFLDQVIQEHLDSSDETGENFLDILLENQKNNIDGVSINLDTVKATILDILLGAIDPTTTALEWAMTLLLRHPLVMDKLQEEVRGILGGKQVITNDDLENLHYLKAVVRETLRYHAPVPTLARVAREDVQVMGYDIKAGTMIITNAWAIGRDPASWYEPDKFQPERFLNSSIDFKGLDFELLPFGAGRRRCPGMIFGAANVDLVLANLVQKFRWGLPKGMKEEDLDMSETFGVTIRRKNPLFAVATPCHF